MILYVDASALVKRYIQEPGTREVLAAMAEAAVVGTCIISRVETAAALAKAVRMGALTSDVATAALQVFRQEWPSLVRVQATELLMARADALAWEHGLRGYDAVHLAAALLWQDGMDEAVTFAVYDRKLWQAAAASGLIPFPKEL
ncbi:MAG: PIN domain-containing protein [Caldilineae bacterium]|nr:MAG: PIN domain-containing protein [Caldilineae bacterium]